MRPTRFIRDFPVPSADDFDEGWPSCTVVCLVDLPDIPGGSQGDEGVWVQVSNQELTLYPSTRNEAIKWLARYEWRREVPAGGNGSEFENMIYVTYVPMSGGVAGDPVTISIGPYPCDLHWFGRSGFNEVKDFGPLPILTTEIGESSWDLDSYQVVESDSGILQEHFSGLVPGDGGGLRTRFRGGGRTILGAGGGSLPVGGTIKSGAGYRLAATGGRQRVSSTAAGTRPGPTEAYIMKRFYCTDGEGGGTDGWFSGPSGGGAEQPFERTLEKVAVVQIVRGADGRKRVVAGGKMWVTMSKLTIEYSGGAPVSWSFVDSRLNNPVDVIASTADAVIQVAGCVIPGSFNEDGTPEIAATSDYDTWPFASSSLTWEENAPEGDGIIETFDNHWVSPAYV